MEHPIFSLATKPDMRFLRYRGSNGDVLEIEPSGKGLPTIFDKDILIFCISQLMHKKNRGEKIGRRVRFSAREMMVATNRRTDGDAYELLEKSFSRLRGTNFKTTIRTGDKMEKRIFGLIDEGGFVYHDDITDKLLSLFSLGFSLLNRKITSWRYFGNFKLLRISSMRTPETAIKV